jgi:ketosteroid isomerase-like protein
VLGELLAPVSEQLMGRSIMLAQRFIAEGDLVVVEAQGRNSTKDGARYHNTYCFVCRLRDGQLVELTEYADTQLVATVLRAPR